MTEKFGVMSLRVTKAERNEVNKLAREHGLRPSALLRHWVIKQIELSRIIRGGKGESNGLKG